MFATFVTVALFMLPVFHRVVADITIYTPTVNQCEDVVLNWEPSTGPYNILVVKASDVCGDALFDLGDHTTNHITWTKAPVPAGSQIVFTVQDATEDEGWTGTVTVGPGSDSSCLNQPPAGPAANAASGPRTSSAAPPASSAPAQAAGAANSGFNPLSSAATVPQMSVPALALSVFASAVALFL